MLRREEQKGQEDKKLHHSLPWIVQLYSVRFRGAALLISSHFLLVEKLNCIKWDRNRDIKTLQATQHQHLCVLLHFSELAQKECLHLPNTTAVVLQNKAETKNCRSQSKGAAAAYLMSGSSTLSSHFTAAVPLRGLWLCFCVCESTQPSAIFLYAKSVGQNYAQSWRGNLLFSWHMLFVGLKETAWGEPWVSASSERASDR